MCAVCVVCAACAVGTYGLTDTLVREPERESDRPERADEKEEMSRGLSERASSKVSTSNALEPTVEMLSSVDSIDTEPSSLVDSPLGPVIITDARHSRSRALSTWRFHCDALRRPLSRRSRNLRSSSSCFFFCSRSSFSRFFRCLGVSSRTTPPTAAPAVLHRRLLVLTADGVSSWPCWCSSSTSGRFTLAPHSHG